MPEKTSRISAKIPRAAIAAGGLLLVEILVFCLVYYWRVFYYLDARGVAWLPIFGVLGVLAALLYCAAVLIPRWVRSFAGRAAICVLACGLLFTFASPPIQVPDEINHFLRSWSISEGYFNFDAARAYPEDVAKLVECFPGAWVNAHTSTGTVENEEGEEEVYNSAGYALKQYGEDGTVYSMADSFAAYFSSETAVDTVTEPLNIAVFPYLAAALGIAVTRLLGFGALGCFYGGRIANLLVYSLLAWLTLRRCRRYRPLFLAVLLLPMSLYLGASYNYDAILLGCYAYLATFFFEEKMEKSNLTGFLVVFLITNAIKPWINLLWLAALLLIPKKSWKVKIPRLAVIAAAIVAAAVISRFIDWYGVAFRVNYPEIGRQMEGASQLDQLWFILRNPLRYLAVLAGTLYENDFFIGQLGVFGALDLPVSVINLGSPVLLLLAAALSTPQGNEKRLLRAGVPAVWAVVYAAGCMTAMYITWTPVGMVRVIGLQARYFLPCFLLLGCALSEGLSAVLQPKAPEKAEKISLVLCGLAAVVGALLLWQHYFIGPVYTIG